MLISSRNTLKDTSRIVFNQISGYPVAQSSGHTRLNNIVTSNGKMTKETFRRTNHSPRQNKKRLQMLMLTIINMVNKGSQEGIAVLYHFSVT